MRGTTILGRGTTVIAAPGGSLAEDLGALAAPRAGSPPPLSVLPAHGPTLPDLASICDAYLAHRHQRLNEVRAAMRSLGPDASITAVTDVVYSHIDPAVRFAAEHSVKAQLAYLNGADRGDE